MAMFATTEKAADAPPRLEDDSTYAEALRIYHAAARRMQDAETRYATTRRDLQNSDTLLVLTARKNFDAVSHAVLEAREDVERAERAVKAAREAAMRPLVEYFRARQRAALAQVRDDLRAVDGGSMRRLLRVIEDGIAAGVFMPAHDVVPSLWLADTTGQTGLDAWEDFQRRNKNF